MTFRIHAFTAICLSLAALSGTRAGATDVTRMPVPVPSGQPVYWLETVHGTPGPHGLTYRFRFVAPDLANLVPETGSAPMEDLTEEDMAALEELAETEQDAGASILSGALGDGLIAADELNSDLAISIHAADSASGAAISVIDPHAIASDGPALPPAPDILLRDPMHDDIVWLCENFVLPRIASPAPRPTQIVISLADRPTKSGSLTQGVVQLFEAFSLPPDRNECVWEPF